MASTTFTIDSFPKGYFMSWLVTTQAQFEFRVALHDSATTYFDKTKQSRDIEPPAGLWKLLIV